MYPFHVIVHIISSTEDLSTDLANNGGVVRSLMSQSVLLRSETHRGSIGSGVTCRLF